jgi:hypothetical protein
MALSATAVSIDTAIAQENQSGNAGGKRARMAARRRQ